MNALMAATVLLGEKTAVLNLHDDNSIVAAMMEPGSTRIIFLCDKLIGASPRRWFLL
jgi:hypothetical protein